MRSKKRPPAQAHRGYADKIRVAWLLDAHHLLDLLGQGVLLFFLFSPTTIMVLMPMAGFLLHQPTLGDPARLFLKLAVLLRVAHRRSPPSVLKRRLPWPLTNAYPMVWHAKQEDP